jgi:RNA polymerase subunit RPABC4/transcription elongation factor Spt4
MTLFPATIRAFRCREPEVRICSRCKTPSPDAVLICPQCRADLTQVSEAAAALARLRANPRVLHVRLIIHEQACPACQRAEGDYDKSQVPAVPIPGCSHEHGCRCFYEPVLSKIYP